MFKKTRKKKARISPSLISVNPVFLFFFPWASEQEFVTCFKTPELLYCLCPGYLHSNTHTRAQFHTCTMVHVKSWGSWWGQLRLSSLTWCPGVDHNPENKCCFLTIPLDKHSLQSCLLRRWFEELKLNLGRWGGDHSGRALQRCSCSLSNVLVLLFWGQLGVMCL